MTKRARDLRSAAHALRTAANALEETVTALRALSNDLNEPDPEPAIPAWPSAPYVVWDGDVLRKWGDFYASAAWKFGSDGLTEADGYGDNVRRFAREAVPVTLVPTEAWEEWERLSLTDHHDTALVDAVDHLAQEVAR